MADKTAILVDDGLATGASMRAAALALREQGAGELVVAVPVAPPETCAAFEQEGVDAAGDTGESDPLLAIQDALQTFPADEIVLFTHAAGDLNWLEERVVEEARERFEIPVDHLIVESSA